MKCPEKTPTDGGVSFVHDDQTRPDQAVRSHVSDAVTTLGTPSLDDDDCAWLVDLACRTAAPMTPSAAGQRLVETAFPVDAIWRRIEARRHLEASAASAGIDGAARTAAMGPAKRPAPERDEVEAVSARAVTAHAGRDHDALHQASARPAGQRRIRTARTLRTTEGRWWTVEDGIRVKTLNVDRRTGARSFLMSIAPGATYPAHPHHYDEECIVLEGDVCIGDHCLEAGDYHLAPAGSTHATLTSRNGALLFLRAGLGDTTPAPVEQAGILWRTLRDGLRERLSGR